MSERDAVTRRNSMDGALVQTNEGPLSGRVFYVNNGLRHWADIEWINENFDGYPGSVSLLPPAVVEAFLPGQPTSRDWSVSRSKLDSIRSVRDAREAVATIARGRGVEIGGGSSPFPVPLSTFVTHADVYPYDKLVSLRYQGQNVCDIVRPEIVTDFTSLSPIGNDTLDFFVACHVIEHSRNPILSIKLALEKLKVGGQLILVVPEISKTFDRKRSLTALDHLVEDFKNPSTKRDEEHFRDFFANAEGFYSDTDGDFESFWRSKLAEDYSIHFHTWTHNSFLTMLDWIRANVYDFSGLWSCDVVGDGIEFYINIQK